MAEQTKQAFKIPHAQARLNLHPVFNKVAQPQIHHSRKKQSAIPATAWIHETARGDEQAPKCRSVALNPQTLGAPKMLKPQDTTSESSVNAKIKLKKAWKETGGR